MAQQRQTEAESLISEASFFYSTVIKVVSLSALPPLIVVVGYSLQRKRYPLDRGNLKKNHSSHQF